MAHQLEQNQGKTFLISPEPLQKSLASLATLAKNQSETFNQLIDFLGCSFFDEINNCSFLLDGNLDDFGFLTNIEMESMDPFFKSDALIQLLQGHNYQLESEIRHKVNLKSKILL